MKDQRTKEKPLYVSIDPQLYKESKSDLLNSQIDLLNSMKHLHNLKQIKEEKFQHKMKLFSLLSSLQPHLDKIEQKLPRVDPQKEPQLKKAKQIQPQQLIASTPEIQQTPKIPSRIESKRQSIEQELSEIQEKLRRLNAK